MCHNIRKSRCSLWLKPKGILSIPTPPRCIMDTPCIEYAACSSHKHNSNVFRVTTGCALSHQLGTSLRHYASCILPSMPATHVFDRSMWFFHFNYYLYECLSIVTNSCKVRTHTQARHITSFQSGNAVNTESVSGDDGT